MNSAMPSPQQRVAVAMSGGVDSSVAAWILKEKGFDVIGIHMKLHNYSSDGSVAKRCCSLEDAIDARSICAQLNIPFYVLDFKKEFQKNVVDYFIDEYQQGRTPNPCVMCNRTIKIHPLLEKVQQLGCDYLATGHYARIETDPATGRLQLLKAADLHKDQTYFLHGTPATDLPHLLFPLAEWTKPQIRQMASKLSISLSAKPDSQEVCFVPKDYRVFLQQHLPEPAVPGNFVSLDGTILGRHQGIPFYTIGQRKGLGLGGGEPYFVLKFQLDSNEIILGSKEAVSNHTVWVKDVNWVSIEIPTQPFTAVAKFRYSHKGTVVTVIPHSASEVEVKLALPEAAITPGQAAVFYQDDMVLGGGWIDRCQATSTLYSDNA